MASDYFNLFCVCVCMLYFFISFFSHFSRRTIALMVAIKLCLSVCQSVVCLQRVHWAKQCVLPGNCLNRQIRLLNRHLWYQFGSATSFHFLQTAVLTATLYMGRLHDPANVQQFTCVLNTFAGSLLDVCWIV